MAKPKPHLPELLSFLELMLRFQDIKRIIYIPNREEPENDAEHSFQLAMLAWYLNEAGQFGLDTGRLLRYALAHDLVEVYTGDIPVLDYARRADKPARDAAARQQLSQDLTAAPELVATLHAYASHDDRESKFVYALDKLIAMLVIYLDHGRSWHKAGYGRAELIANKRISTSLDPEIHRLWLELADLLEQHPEYFPKP